MEPVEASMARWCSPWDSVAVRAVATVTDPMVGALPTAEPLALDGGSSDIELEVAFGICY